MEALLRPLFEQRPVWSAPMLLESVESSWPREDGRHVLERALHRLCYRFKTGASEKPRTLNLDQ